MKIVEPSYEIVRISGVGIEELQALEYVARKCYKSGRYADQGGDSARRLIRMLVVNGHEAMLEHGVMTVHFICDRGVSHELVRHRIASFAQESTRYCNYSKDHFGNEISVIKPRFAEDSEAYKLWHGTMLVCEAAYMEMIEDGCTAQDARSVLPNSLKTEVIMTANWREWRNVFKLRCAKDAHPDMRDLMVPLCLEMQERIPILFDDCYTCSSEEEKAKWMAAGRGKGPLSVRKFLTGDML